MTKSAWLPLAILSLSLTGFSISACVAPSGPGSDGPFALAVVDAGSGTGTVTAAGAGSTTPITCVSGQTQNCTADYDSGSVVTLTATPAANSSFVGWSGACTGATTCQVTMSEAQTVAAQFNIANDAVQIMIAGSGQGTVTSSPSGLDCGNYSGAPVLCSESVVQAGMVTLTEAPQAGSTFVSWGGGGCSGSLTTCLVDVTQAESVTATFTVIQLTAPLVTSIAQGASAQGQVGALALNYYIATQGIFPSNSGSVNTTSNPYLGQIMLFAGNFAPAGWLPCDGALLSISQNAALFNLLGATYGGNGTSNFALPDLRGHAAMGSGAMVGGTAVTTSAGTTVVPVVSSLALGAASQGEIQAQGIGYYVALQGIYPSTSSGSGTPGATFLGQIILFAGTFTPGGFAPCSGQLLPINQNTALFSLLGTTYGGNGTSNFALPNLNGRLPMGSGTLVNPSIPPQSSTEVPLISSIVEGETSQGQVGVLGLNYVISTLGIYPSVSASGVANGYVAELILFAGGFTPQGFSACNGALLPISQNTAFFSLIGTTYGGNGTSTFAVPDLRGRVAVGSN